MPKLVVTIEGQAVTPTRNGKDLHHRNRLRLGDQVTLKDGVYVVTGFRGEGPLLFKASSPAKADELSTKAQAMRTAGVAC